MEKMVIRVVVTVAAAALVGCGTVATGDKEPDPTNELPIGFLDAPIPNATVDHQFRVEGWALDDTGVDFVRVYVDGKYVATARIELDRPDVSKVFPRYTAQGDKHGWRTTVMVAPGPHMVIVQAVDRTGATRDIGAVPVTVKP